LRVFARTTEQQVAQQRPVPPPAIAYPPNGTVVPLPGRNDKDQTIMLKADGGRAPLTWLVNGMLVGSFDRFQPALYLPQGEGNARITVVDSDGRSDTATVRFKRDK
jgi:penicillin-binding protein 1C